MWEPSGERMHQDWGSGKSWIQEPRTPPHTHSSGSSDPDKATAGHVSAEKPDLGRGEVSLRVRPPVGKGLQSLCFLQWTAAWVCLFPKRWRQHGPEASTSIQRSLCFPSTSPWESSGSTVAASLHVQRAAFPALESHTASEQHRSRWRHLSTLAARWDLWALRDR